MTPDFSYTYNSIVDNDTPFEVHKADGKYVFEFLHGLVATFNINETELRYSTRTNLSAKQHAAFENFKKHIKDTRPSYFDD